jgi:hypothetical protein
MSTPTKPSVTVKAAWINFAGLIAAAIVAALLTTVVGALLRPSPLAWLHPVPKDPRDTAATHPPYPLPREISAALDRVPPFQRAEAAKHYQGLKVSWDVYLFSVETTGPNSVKVDFQDATPGGPPTGVRCKNVALADNLELKILKQGARLRVDGTIAGVEPATDPRWRAVLLLQPCVIHP